MASVTPLARRWVLTRPALVGLLSSLDSDEERAALEYERLRHKLIIFFSGRSCPNAEDCADETLDRVSRRIEGAEDVRDVGRFAYGVARLVFAEVLKTQRRREKALSRAVAEQRLPAAAAAHEETFVSDSALECLRGCAAHLTIDDRELAAVYYQSSGRDQQRTRKELAARLGISVPALRLRAFRVRRILHTCTRACLERREATNGKIWSHA